MILLCRDLIVCLSVWVGFFAFIVAFFFFGVILAPPLTPLLISTILGLLYGFWFPVVWILPPRTGDMKGPERPGFFKRTTSFATVGVLAYLERVCLLAISLIPPCMHCCSLSTGFLTGTFTGIAFAPVAVLGARFSIRFARFERHDYYSAQFSRGLPASSSTQPRSHAS